MVRRFLSSLLFASAVTLLASGPAGAGVIFDMTGSCTAGPFCGSTGQNNGDPISGFVEFNNFDSAANGAFLIPDDWHLEFGNVILDPADESQVFVKSGHDTFQKLDANHIGPGSFVAWSTTQNIPLIFIGQCCGANPQTDHWVFGFAPGSSGPFAFTREDPVSTPEPGATAPFGAALVFGTWLFWRRRNGASA
jgi:hypothetical protein